MYIQATAALTFASAAAVAAAAAARRAFLAAALVLATTAGLVVGFVGFAANVLLQEWNHMRSSSGSGRSSLGVCSQIWCARAVHVVRTSSAGHVHACVRCKSKAYCEHHSCSVGLRGAPGKQRTPALRKGGVCCCAACNQKSGKEQDRGGSAPLDWCRSAAQRISSSNHGLVSEHAHSTQTYGGMSNRFLSIAIRAGSSAWCA